MVRTPTTMTTGVRRVDRADAAVLVLGPASRDAVRDEAPGTAEGGEDDGEQVDRERIEHGRSLRADARAARSPDGQAPAAPASASSTSVAWVTPVAPRGAYG